MGHKHINITLDESVIALPLGASVEEIQTILASTRYDQDDDPEVNTTYFELPDDGIDIVVNNGTLSTVFLHLMPHDDRSSIFVGSTNYLGRAFFDTPSADLFEQTLAHQGFIRLSRQYPNNAVDMLTDEVRLRYEDRQGELMICFDDGARVRGK